jgi:hypothetical protein
MRRNKEALALTVKFSTESIYPEDICKDHFRITKSQALDLFASNYHLLPELKVFAKHLTTLYGHKYIHGLVTVSNVEAVIHPSDLEKSKACLIS